MAKEIFVQTNDKANPNIRLKISGNVDNFATIEPRRISLNGPANEPIQASVSIIPDNKYPFTIIETKAVKGDNIGLKLEQIKGEKNLEYKLIVENTLKIKGRYFDTVVLKTDSPIQPEIKVSVYGNIMDPVQK